MTDRIRILRHEAVPNCGSYEVRIPDGRASVFFYWDDVPGRQLQPDRLTGAEALAALATTVSHRSLPPTTFPAYNRYGTCFKPQP
jgi:hypothetical protein